MTRPMMTQDVFEDICDILNISEDERKFMQSMKIELEIGGIVKYTTLNVPRVEDE